eukprot:GHVS01074169.1.p1 GENE.GHVS01074169.1~~GHVS01074169.1.p1  ORF type:complete len:237 (-),score=33.32 GHVS01074169.1:364-1074(-)
MATKENILFVGIGRIRDQVTLASSYDRITTQEKSQLEDHFQRCLGDAVSRCSPGGREKRVFGDSCFFLLADNDLCALYGVACRTKSYPERHAFALLGEVVRLVGSSLEDGGDVRSYLNSLPMGGLTKQLRKPLKELTERFDQPTKFDKAAEVQAKVDSTKGVMEENLKKILESHAHIGTLQDKTDNLASSASQFNRSAGDLRRMMWLRKIKVSIILGIVVAAVVAYLVVMVVRMVE